MQSAAKQMKPRESGAKASGTPFFGTTGHDAFFPSTSRSQAGFFQAVQPKLTIGEPGDKYEKEADAVADHVARRMPQSPAPSKDREEEKLQRKCEDCKKEETIRKKEKEPGSEAAERSPAIQPVKEEKLQKKDNGAESTPGSAFTAELHAGMAGGIPLPEPVRSPMESAMGADLSGVRIHTGSAAARLSESIHAQAFTYRNHIYFNQGKYDPGSFSGRHLLAHELTHTVQQGASPAGAAALPATSRGPPSIHPYGGSLIQRSVIDQVLAYTNLSDLMGCLGFDTDISACLRRKASEVAMHIPGYRALRVALGRDPISGIPVERNGQNLLDAALDLVPGGGLIKQKLVQDGLFGNAVTWIDGQIARLENLVSGLFSEFSNFWNRTSFSLTMSPMDILRDGINIVLRFTGNLIDFALDAGRQLIELIKNFMLNALVDFVRQHTNAYPLLTVILGQDPITKAPVDRNGANILYAILELGGEEGRNQRTQMQETGTYQRIVGYIDEGIVVFGDLYQSILSNFDSIWSLVTIEALLHPIQTFQSVFNMLAEPVRRVLSFVERVAAEILRLVKQVLKQRLSQWAEGTRGYRLVTVIIGQDPFTGEAVPFTMENVLSGFFSLMEGGEEQFNQLKESGAIERTTDRITQAVQALNMTPAAIVQLFTGLWNSFSISDLMAPVACFERILGTFGQPILRLMAFVIEIVRIVIETILVVMNFPFDVVNQIIARTIEAMDSIKRDPVGFLKNLLRAIKQGFVQFFENILQHLTRGLVGWLMSELREAGVPELTDLSLRGVISWVLEVLNISMERIWEKLAAHPRIGPQRVARIRGMIHTLEGIWTFIKDVQERGMAAIWDKIREQLSNLWDTVLDAVKNWVMDRIINRITARLLSMLDPTGIMAVVNSVIAIYNAVQSFVKYLRQMLEIVNSFVSGVADIASGNITTAASYLEQTMSRAMPIVIGFLANQVGLSGIGRQIGLMIGQAREMADQALTWLVNKAVDTGMGLLDRVMAMGRNARDTVLGWLGLRRNFTAVDGEEHSLYTVERGGRTELMVASWNPTTVSNFIANLDTNGNQRLQRAKADLNNKLSEMDLHLAWMSSSVAATAQDNEKQRRQQYVEELGADISETLSVLMATAGNHSEAAVTTNPVYDGLYGASAGGWGRGMRVQIVHTVPPGGTGTGAASGHVSWQALRKRKAISTTGKPLYVQGHLLNHLLGGPGENFSNLTPLVGSANGEFERDAESYIKNRLGIRTGSAATAGNIDTGYLFIYTVVPAYGRTVNQALINQINAVPTGAVSGPETRPTQLTASDKADLINIIQNEIYVPTQLRYDILVKDPLTNIENESMSVRNHVIHNNMDQSHYIINSGAYVF